MQNICIEDYTINYASMLEEMRNQKTVFMEDCTIGRWADARRNMKQKMFS